MRKLLLLIFSLPVFLLTARATAQDKEAVRVTDFTAFTEGSSAYLRFTLQIGKKTTPNNSTLVIQPTLKSGAQELLLTPVVVEGKRARVTPMSRAQAVPKGSNPQPYYTANGATVHYEAIFPLVDWMSGSELLFNGAKVSRQNTEEAPLGSIAANLFRTLPQPPEPEKPLVVIAVDPPGSGRPGRVSPNNRRQTGRTVYIRGPGIGI